MVVPSTADGFRAAVSALRSLNGREGVSFHTFTLPEDRCVRLLVKNLGRGIPESVVREELESLNFCVQGVTQLRSGRRDQDPATERPPTPTSLFQWRKDLRCQKSHLTELCGLRVSVESYVSPKDLLQCKRCQRFGSTQRNCGYATRCFACGGSHLSGGCSTPREQPQCCGCGGNHTANYRGCVEWKEAKAALAKQAADRGRKSTATAHLTAPPEQRARHSAEQMDLGEGWNHVVRGGRVVKATTQPNPIQNPLSHPVTETSEKPKVTATRKTARPQKSEHRTTAAPKLAAGKSKKKAASVKTTAAKPTTPNLFVPNRSSISLLEEISDLDYLPLHACVELTRRLLTSVSSLPTGAARPRAVL